MTSLEVGLSSETYSHLLHNYIKSKQLAQAMKILEEMPPSDISFSRFLQACVDRGDMDMALRAWDLIDKKGHKKQAILYNHMIKGFGKQGNIKEAFDLIKEMESSGLMSSSDTLCNVLDVCLMVSEVDRAFEIGMDLYKRGHPLNLSRAARLIHSLSIERRVDESFQVFASSLESRVGANTGICHDLIDLATECSSPNKILQVYDCIQQRDIKIDTFHRHALVSLLCQMDAFVFAQEAMNGLAMGPQRANAESYLELVGAGFRAGSSEECLAIVKEFIQIAPRARRPTIDFFNFCLRGFRVLKDSSSCLAVFDLLEEEESLEADNQSHSLLVSCLLECKKYSRALMCYERMIELNFQPGSDLMNTYIECLAASKNPEHHELAWGMYLRALRAGHMKASSHVAMYDSCTVHARIGRLTEVAHHMGEARTAELGKKRFHIVHLVASCSSRQVAD
uniref:Pentatricopeptide repeat-containing protein-mitochondrial domain-containing protein n=1 Tax=Guillardia theta TaxID=55529 RepID=A0A6U5XUM6_GUITH|mmetsp:Transcript_19528/g.64828  ORF Transcript_19528/g.64828 Transcript_19528/m.64828 type:complete len:452 (+) Transcript_19528:114-1469(+)